MESCNGCVYQRYPKIPPVKPFKTRLAIVGEAPGAVELGQKKAFVGPSGQLLNKALDVTGFPPREEIFVTNALLCRPPNQKPKLKEAIRTCQPRLFEELEQVRPEVVLVLGNIAMHAITGNYDLRITQEQGRVLESKYLPGVKIVPMLHPAAILRAPGDYKTFYAAMSKAQRVFSGGEISDPGNVTWKVVDTEEKLSEALEVISQKELIAADIETTGLNSRRDTILVLGVAYEKNKAFVFPPEMIRKELFEIPSVQWIWHNGKFDINFLRRRGYPAEVHHDTQLASYALNEHGGVHSLEAVATRVLGAPAYKHKAKEKSGGKGFAHLPWEDLCERVAVDVDYTLQSFLILHEKIKKSANLNKLYHELFIPANMFLRNVERNGIYVNRKLLEEYKTEYQENLDEIMDRILDIAQPLWNPERYKVETGARTAPEVFNPGSPYQVAWLLYDVLQLRPRGRKKGRSTDKEMLGKMEGMHPIIDAMLEYRSVSKELSTYILGVEQHIADDDRVHTTYKIHGTVTGRLSSSEPNVQNQPKRKPKVRNMYQAPQGKKFVEVDYKGAELRVLAHVSNDEALKTCFIEGRDLHAEVAQALNTPRIRAKAVNFGIAYGRTEYSFAEEFGVPVDEARQYLYDWFKRFPQAKEYMDSCRQKVRKGEPLVTPFGRYRRFGLVTQETVDAIDNEARNFVIQSVASDLTLLSAMKMEDALKTLGVKIVNLVHDSILFECPDDDFVIRRTMQIAVDVMRQMPIDTLETTVPFAIEVSIGTQWGALEVVDHDEFIKQANVS